MKMTIAGERVKFEFTTKPYITFTEKQWEEFWPCYNGLYLLRMINLANNVFMIWIGMYGM